MRLIAKSTLGNGQVTVTENETTGNPTVYALLDQDNITIARLHLQDGAPPQNGFCIEDLLEITIHRIRTLNGEVPSQHNLTALDGLDRTMRALAKRSEERAAEIK